MTIVTAPPLPALISCAKEEADGSVIGTDVKVVSGDWLELVMESYRAFEKKRPGIPEVERKRLRYFVQLLDAAQCMKPEKLRACARSIASLDPIANTQWSPEQIEANPIGFLQQRVTQRSRTTSLVMWRERKSGTLSAGLLCKGGMLEALYVLLLIYIASGRTSKTGECVACGRILARERGHRRKTCSDACRKRASRSLARES